MMALQVVSFPMVAFIYCGSYHIPSKEHKYVNLRGGISPLLTYVFMTGCGHGYCPGRSQYRRHLIMAKTVKCMDCCIFLTQSINKNKDTSNILRILYFLK